MPSFSFKLFVIYPFLQSVLRPTLQERIKSCHGQSRNAPFIRNKIAFPTSHVLLSKLCLFAKMLTKDSFESAERQGLFATKILDFRECMSR